jgi:hypothetical protein
MDLLMLPILGAVAFLLFRHASAFSPGEGAILMVAATGLLIAGIRW